MADNSLVTRAKTFWRSHAPTSYARIGTAWHFWRVSENARARLAVVAYALGYPGVIGAERTVHVFDARRGEFADVYAILVDRMYERVAGFAPRANAVVVDVGANVGTFSLHHAGHGARVYAFEPQPEPFRRFRRAIALSGLSATIKVAPIALADYTGHGSLDTSNPSTTMARLGEAGREGPIAVQRLDDVLGGLRRVDLLKIDTEGAEDAVLVGAHNLLARTERVVLEYHDRQKYARCRELLQAANFTIVAHDQPDGPAALGLIFAEKRP